MGGDNTNIEGHKKKAKEIEDSLGKLLPELEGGTDLKEMVILWNNV